MPDPIPFIDLESQRKRLGGRLDGALSRVLEHGQYVMGPEIAELEGASRRSPAPGHAA